MTEPIEDRPTFMPIAIAAAIVVVALGGIWVLRLVRGDDVPDDGLVGRAVVAQNDALQRENYDDFRTYTCAAQQGTEAQVLADQRQSKSAKGNRFVDDVKGFTATGDRATATVVSSRAPPCFINLASSSLCAPLSGCSACDSKKSPNRSTYQPGQPSLAP